MKRIKRILGLGIIASPFIGLLLIAIGVSAQPPNSAELPADGTELRLLLSDLVAYQLYTDDGPLDLYIKDRNSPDDLELTDANGVPLGIFLQGVDEPAPTPTPVPLPTSTPGSGPDDNTPPCLTHDKTQWHAVYDGALDCHYDHHHGSDPAAPEIVAIFGPPGELWGGDTVSYPWETPEENKYKHKAYQWFAWIYDECIPVRSSYCVQAIRFQFHMEMGILGLPAKDHSLWAEIQACDSDGDCGTLKTGGQATTGCGYSPYFGQPVEGIPGQDNSACPQFSNGIPYRTLARKGDSDSSAKILWSYSNSMFYNLVVSNLDPWAAVNPNDFTDWEYICPSFDCANNGSLTQVTNWTLAPAPAEAVGTFSGFTNLDGELDDSCSEVSPVCVPFETDNWTSPNRTDFHRNTQWGGGFPRDPKRFTEFDNSPAVVGTGAKYWIRPMTPPLP